LVSDCAIAEEQIRQISMVKRMVFTHDDFKLNLRILGIEEN
jgi:hypothetical protein